ncbi:hypothetical protein CXF72_11235 [Psychromonas sp. MB-3u-54]|uniref:helix-turn-helix domain-containing protein n=1 Tax=Psychromonas sp. MB-3u-54 TaxID=2058319 RepID=UPI000C342F5F|nr:helix-turn-helix transcriptional regulator [Psychromonas sp. MB-3u-54]PKH02515.1 hypothetical protein CXF72_11235 [Psychromonas sp. MB-3u-54]
MDNNLDRNCIEENAINEAIKAGVKELNEENKKEMKKSWLTQRISEVGEETLLYPKVNAETHPYTKEVILIAGTQGYKQEPISKICGVSQSQVSLWERGINQATIDQLGPLIAKLSPRVPGNAFHYKTIVSRTYIELPDDWEKEMLLNAYSTIEESEPVQSFMNKSPALEELEIVEKSYYSNLSFLKGYEGCPISESAPSDQYDYSDTRFLTASLKNIERFTNDFENIEKSVLGNLKISYEKASLDISDNFKKQKEEKELLIKKINEMKDDSDSELSEYESALLKNDQQRSSYLLDNSELTDLPENKLNEFLNKNFPSPEKRKEYKDMALLQLTVVYTNKCN